MSTASEETESPQEIETHSNVGVPYRSTPFTVISWILLVVWACFIFFMSTHTGNDLNQGTSIISQIYQAIKEVQTQLLGPDSDLMSSVAHFLAYCLFGLLWFNALRCHMPISWALVLAIVFASLYGVTDEFHQLFVEDRECDPMDWLVDTIGAAVGAVLTLLVARHRIRRHAQLEAA